MSHGKDNGRTWQALETEGDRLWEEALWAETLAVSRQRWSSAGDIYQKALGKVLAEAPKSLSAARLYRKVGRYMRQNRLTDQAMKKLSRGLDIVKGLPRTEDTLLERLLEETWLSLEVAFCYFDKGFDEGPDSGYLPRGMQRAEDIIKICLREPLYERPEVWSILGAAYNLLGIALNELPRTSSSFGRDPEGCWKEAEHYYSVATDPRGKRGRQDLEINRAVRARRRGHCDRAIEILEGVLGEKLPPQRSVLARDILAAAYLDRLDSGDLDKAVRLAEQNLERAKQHQDIREWVWALEIRLKTLREEINVSDEEGRSTLPGQAFGLYNRGLDLVRSEELGKREASSARLELNRVMAEIYLAAGEVQKSSTTIDFIQQFIHNSEWKLDTEWETGDIFVTLAMFDREQWRLEQALNNLKQARMWFKRGDNRGKVVETEIERAKIHILQEAWADAQTTLEEALGIAHQLECQRRISRIEDLLEEVRLKSDWAQRPTEAIEVFFSYAHEDGELRDELEKHLSILKRQRVITSWHDRKIGAGKEWEGEIDTHLNTAHVILLLISPDFMASDYCWDVEVKRAMKRHETGKARVIPVILRPVDWRGAPFSKLQALPKDAKPVSSWANRDEALLEVARGIRAAVMELRGV